MIFMEKSLKCSEYENKFVLNIEIACKQMAHLSRWIEMKAKREKRTTKCKNNNIKNANMENMIEYNCIWLWLSKFQVKKPNRLRNRNKTE